MLLLVMLNRTFRVAGPRRVIFASVHAPPTLYVPNNLTLQAVLLVFIMSALIILARTSDLRQSATLQELMGVVSGRAGSLVTSVIVTVYTFGTCITFLIIIGDQFDRAFDSLVGPDFCDRIYLNRNFLMPVTSSKCSSNERYCS